MFTPRFLHPILVTQFFDAACAEIEKRLLSGYIDHVLEPEREGHFDEGGVHDQGEAKLAALEVERVAMLQRICNPPTETPTDTPTDTPHE